MLTNYEIEDLSKRMSIPLEFVNYKDQLKYEAIQPNKLYVLNLEDKDDDGSGTHWVGLQIEKNKKTGNITPMYFDPIGSPPPEEVKYIIKKQFNKYLNYSTKNVQSIVNDLCGWFVLAWGYFISNKKFSVKNIFNDTINFLGFFDDLNHVNDFHKNEFILKHFFQGEDPNTRLNIEVFEAPKIDDKYKVIGETLLGDTINP